MMNPTAPPSSMAMMSDGSEEGKIFVGGLSWETNEDNLRNYFSEFGEVTECLVMKNQTTGKSRGFGFVTFLDPNSVKKVLRISNHQLDGRTIDPKECNPRTAAKIRRDYKQTNTSKIFLGGLPPNITETNLREFFSKYGKVTEAIIMFDQEKKKSRGFGFLSFDSEDAINKVVAEHYVTINGKQVEVKRAEPQHAKSGTPAPNGNIPHGPSMNPMFFPHWTGLWQPSALMPPMNGLTPAAYPGNVWNPTTAAAAAAAIAATTMPGATTPPSWPPFGPYGPGWAFPGPYGQPPPGSFGQPGNSSGQNAPTGAHGNGSGGSTGPPGFLPAPNSVASLNQNVPNGSAGSLPGGMIPPGLAGAGIGNFQHESSNNFGTGRGNLAFGASGSYVGPNTHGNAAAVGQLAAAVGNNAANWNPPGSFAAAAAGQGNTNGVQGPAGVQGPHHNESAMAVANSYNQSLQFHGSRIVSQNQGYHPYRRP